VERCRHCGQPIHWNDSDEPWLSDKVAELVEVCRAEAIPLLRGKFVDVAGVAKLTGISEKTVSNWRYDLAGPLPFIKIRRRAWFNLRDIQDSKSTTHRSPEIPGGS